MLDDNNNCYYIGNNVIYLDNKETELLSILLMNKGKTVKYNKLDRNCKTIISRLKKKIKINIKTIRGIGLRID